MTWYLSRRSIIRKNLLGKLNIQIFFPWLSFTLTSWSRLYYSSHGGISTGRSKCKCLYFQWVVVCWPAHFKQSLCPEAFPRQNRLHRLVYFSRKLEAFFHTDSQVCIMFCMKTIIIMPDIILMIRFLCLIMQLCICHTVLKSKAWQSTLVTR